MTPMINDFDLSKTIEPLQNWFEENQRTLPWRSNPLPYYVWVSEIMLQQTRVEAVKPYFARFVTHLPDIESLANCDEETLLKLWEGLGYYNRVRNMQLAARTIMETYDGVMPSDYEALCSLKGIGHYTAGAIASIAFGKPVPAVDGNVLRVLTRLCLDDTDIMKESMRRNVEGVLLTLMEKESDRLQPRIYNQALMELGALVCVPNGTPHCANCPWESMCLAKKEGKTDCLPVKKKAKERRIEQKTVLVIRDGNRVAISKRPSKGLLAGLYELPNVPKHLSQEEVLEYLSNLGYRALRIQPLSTHKHVFSHVEWHMIGYVVFVEPLDYEGKENKEHIFVEAKDARERYAIPSAFVKYAAYMNLVDEDRI